MAAALPDKDYRSMLNFSIAKGSGSPPDPNIYYRIRFVQHICKYINFRMQIWLFQHFYKLSHLK